ncbi:isoprenyl transferase [Bacteroidales bacterium OttesenSCG-928-C19]|nr:isoprenyl transferase [Bacteroidales bacterium OttesenSCG-928-C19]
MEIKSLIDKAKLPKHVAIIMDGNGRWAKQQGKERVFGHQNGIVAVRETVEAAAEIGVEVLTLYAFSTENWKRPQEEVNALMDLFIKAIQEELETLNKNNIKLEAIGDLKALRPDTYAGLMSAIENTSKNTGLTLVLALSYSGRWEITHAMKSIAEDVAAQKITPEEITQDTVSAHLQTANYPDPELLIRTSGEYRLSNFLLWQLAYAEFYFLEKHWPDFRKDDFFNTILDFQKRERRFGMTGEQIS